MLSNHGLPLDWAALAKEEGFADQAYMFRTTKHLTSFSPTNFARLFGEEETF